MQGMQKPDKISLGSLITSLKKGNYVIPDFQRDFEWNPSDVCSLLKSIFSDYYIGTPLLWKGDKNHFNILSCKPIYGFEGESNDDYIVLDGQQRLSALYYAFFYPTKSYPKRKSRCFFYLNIKTLTNGLIEESIEYAFAERWAEDILNNPVKQYKDHLFPFKIMSSEAWGIVDWISGYISYWENIVETSELEDEIKEGKEIVSNKETLKKIFSSLMQEYQLSYIELDKSLEVDKVCEIFTQINSRGIKLDIFDLLNAMLRPKEIFLKKMWKDCKKELAYADFGKMNVYLLQVISIIKQSYCSPKYLYYLVPGAQKPIKLDDGKLGETILIDSSETFEKLWHRAVETTTKTIERIKNPRGYAAIKPAFIPYPSIIPALSSIRSFLDQNTEVDGPDSRKKIDQWYWASIFTQRYSSSVESTSAKDYQDLQKWFYEDDFIPSFINSFEIEMRGINIREERRKGSAIYKAIFNLYVLKGALDFKTLETPEHGELDDHHIVPVSWGKKNGISDIDSILNRTPLTPKTNRKILRAQLPNIYLKELLANNDPDSIRKMLATHFINDEALEVLLKDPFTPEDFRIFLNIRQELVMRGIEDILIQGLTDLTPDLLDLKNEIGSLEKNLRQLISVNLNNDLSLIPSDIRINIEETIDRAIKKNPSLNPEKLKNMELFLSYSNFSDCFFIIENKNCWQKFENIFGKKESFKPRWEPVLKLRNSLAHNRLPNEMERRDGEVALIWMQLALDGRN